MAQTVISPSYQMKISGRTVPYSPNWKVTRTGYHPIKWSIDDDADNVLSKAASWNSLPIIRYAEILLNYVEALNEYDPGNPDILTYLNMVRKRAGVPDIEKVYPEAVGNQTQMRELIRRERMVELCYENHRRNGARRRLRHEHRRDEPQRQQRFLETHAQHPRQRIERQRTSKILAARLPLPHFAGGDGPYGLHAELRLVTLIQFRQS